MKPRLLVPCFLAALLAAHPGAPANATSDYTYKRNEYVTITDGMAPDKKHSIATHGEVDLGYDSFHVYLMREPGQKKIGPLTEIGDNEYLGTAPDAFWARWSPDSRHVAILYRADRRIITLRIYRIEKGRAHLVTGTTPLKAAGLTIDLPWSAERPDLRQQRMRGFTLTWTASTRFRLAEDGRVWVDPNNALMLEKYGIITKDPGETHAPDGLHQVEYKIDADCEIVDGDKYKVIEAKPGK